jgi:1-deoxy-D-xylulose-5-phosphate synthase
VELTVALHKVFRCAEGQDRLGCRSPGLFAQDADGPPRPVSLVAPGRRHERLLSRDESVYDAFGAGHASTSISAALGMCVAENRKPQKDQGRVVAVIGDGALTGGMAFEGLNNAGHLDFPFIVVLNDNEMSIAPNVGALSKYLDRCERTSSTTRPRTNWPT